MGHDESVAKAIDRMSNNIGKWLSTINDTLKAEGADQQKLDALTKKLKDSNVVLEDAIKNQQP